MLRVSCKYVEVMGFNRSKSSGGSGMDSSTGGSPRSCGIRSSGTGFGGVVSSSLSGAWAPVTGVEVEAGLPVLELENKDFVRLIGVWALSFGGAVGVAVETVGERARSRLSGEVLNAEGPGFGPGEVALGGGARTESEVVVMVDVVVGVVGTVGVVVVGVEMLVG